ncbi:MAG: site-2 protease family protein [Pseudomonadota bacterium]|nr:site-2 protease family protein [Pseudomonadota bacterium]
MPADLLRDVLAIAILALPIVIAITFHEAAHGFVARLCGDDTATRLGRVTFNPLKHIDLFGTILLPAFLLLTHTGILFGYAKPVPVNFAGLRHPKRDMIWVAAAGPATNLVLAAASTLCLYLALRMGAAPDGAWVTLFLGSLEINLVLAVLNMLPLPPLDGGRVATGLLPSRLAVPFARIEPYGFVILIGALFLLPWAGDKLGVNLDVFGWLVGKPTEWLLHAALRAIGAK